MLNSRISLLVLMLLSLFSGDALAYQYGYYQPQPYTASRAYYNPAVRVAYPYYPAYRYPTPPAYRQARMPQQLPHAPGVRLNAKAQDNSAEPAKPVATKPESDNNAFRHEYDKDTRKQEFIALLLPYIETENRRLTALRHKVGEIFNRLETDSALSASEKQLIEKLTSKYRVTGNPLETKTARKEMLRKIDIIPSSLALAQAANESAWGESRFAQQANNLFGIWTYDQDKGLKPKNREEGKTHLVRIFDDVGESVQYYMHTLNSHPAYAGLRKIRQQLRSNGHAIDGHQLAAGLEKYSARGQVYIDLIRSLIKQNDWALLDAVNQRA